MSGTKTKLYNINNQLSQSLFNVYIIQETWLNSTVTDLEITASTNYSIIRNDRATFSTNLKKGGGVMMLIHKSFAQSQIVIHIKTIVEIQAAEIILPDDQKIIICNVYAPPNRARTAQARELKRIIDNVRRVATTRNNRMWRSELAHFYVAKNIK